MNRLSIFTFHKSINHGAFLQAYALKNFIKNELNYDVYFVNYSSFNDIFSLLFVRNPFRFLYNLLKIISFVFYQKAFLKSSKHVFNSVIGSDIILSFKFNFLKKPLKNYILFSPSVGNMSICPLLLDNFNDCLFFSGRDKETVLFLEKFSNNVAHTVDPIFLFDWKHLLSRSHKLNYKYILVYGYTFDDVTINTIISLGNAKNLKVLSVGYYNRNFENIISFSPFDLVKYIFNAEYIITGTFHGAMFSINFQKKFLIISNKYIFCKIHSILNKLNIEQVILDQFCLHHINLLSHEFDYDSKLLCLIDDSKTFLTNSILVQNNLTSKDVL